MARRWLVNEMKTQVKRFFFEKKKQKTFAPGAVLVETPMAPGQKFFAELFFKKATAFSLNLGCVK